jgi:hypothetical protein
MTKNQYPKLKKTKAKGALSKNPNYKDIVTIARAVLVRRGVVGVEERYRGIRV